MDEEEVRLAFENDVMNTLVFAMQYHGAAHVVDQQTEFKWDHDDTFRPAMFLISQSIELSLKAYLRTSGLSRSDLQYKFGHNLRRLLRRAEKLGLDLWPLDVDDRDALIDANVLYSKKHLQYFYREENPWPNFNRLSRMAAVITYRTAEKVPFAPLFFTQEYAKAIVSHLAEINLGQTKPPFALPEVVGIEQMLPDDASSNEP